MAKNPNSLNIGRDSALPPCLFELAFRYRHDPAGEAASKLTAFLAAQGATEEDIEDSFSELRVKGLLEFPEGHSVEMNRELYAFCSESENCQQICSFLFTSGEGTEDAYCSICPITKRLGGVYLNAYEDEEAHLLAMLVSLMSAGQTDELHVLGVEKMLSTLFQSQVYVSVFERHHIFPIAYIIAYALYLMAESRIEVGTESADSMTESIVSILSSRNIPGCIPVNDYEKLFVDDNVRRYVEILQHRAYYREIDYVAAFRVLDARGCEVFKGRRGQFLGTSLPDTLVEFLNEEVVWDTEPDTEEASQSDGSAPDEGAAHSQCEEPANDVVVVEPISDDNAPTESRTSLAEVRTATRSIDKAKLDGRGVWITPLSSTGDAVTGCIVGQDGLINPYVSLGDTIKRPKDVPGLTPFTLVISLESTQFYTVEYAICDGEEGFLLYIYQRRCTIFVGRSDWEYYLVVLASFRRSIPKKLTMLAAPLLDYLSRMGETLHRGIVPVYEAYRIKMRCQDEDVVKITELLLPDTQDLPTAMRQYSMIWKRTGLSAKDLEGAVCESALFSSSVYASAFTYTRYPHLYHDGISYRLAWNRCRLRADFVKMTYHLDRENTNPAERRKCYRAMLRRLGNGSLYLLRGLNLASCDPDNGLSVVVPMTAYPWAHNFLFLRLGEVARKLLGRDINVTEECVCGTDATSAKEQTAAPKTEPASQEGAEAKEPEDSGKPAEMKVESSAVTQDGQDSAEGKRMEDDLCAV